MNGITVSFKWKSTLYVLSRCFHSQKLEVYYSKYCKILCRVIREAKKMYYNQSIVKRDTGRKCSPEHLPLLFKNENILIYPIQAADGFNN